MNAVYRNPNGVFWTKQQAAEGTNLGLTKVDEIARKAGARIKIGKAVRYDREKLVAYIREEFQAKAAEKIG